MKRILSLLLAVMMLVSAAPTAFAADSSEGTDIVMTGAYATETYTVTVPAQLAPGESGEVVLKGGWSPNKTVKVSCPNSVTLTYEGQTIDVGISFPGITQAGSMDDAINRVETISVESKSVAFGTWTGHLAYTVEVVEEANLISFTIDGTEYQAEEGMDWFAWADSSYFPQAEGDDDPPVMVDSGGVSYYYSGIAYNDTLVNPNDEILPVYYYTME